MYNDTNSIQFKSIQLVQHSFDGCCHVRLFVAEIIIIIKMTSSSHAVVEKHAVEIFIINVGQ